ncbi:MAG: thermonuclease family protein [Desulfobulbus sp.]
MFIRYRRRVGIVVVAALLCLHFGVMPAWAWTGKVVKIQDGDSFKVRKGAKIYGVRLYGIDCPEFDQEYGMAAKQRLAAMIPPGTRVVIDVVDVDSYGRVVALVSSGSRLVNAELVRSGAAWVTPRYCRQKSVCRDFRRLEQEARKQRRGLWRSEHPEPPWRWRRR